MSSTKAASTTRGMLLRLEGVAPDHQPLAVGLQFAMNAVHAQWSALHMKTADARAEMIVAAPAPDGGAFADFLSSDLSQPIGTLVAKVLSTGTPIAVGAGRGASHQLRLPACSALCVPLFDQERTRPVGTLTLLCNDAGRAWTSDEQALVGTAAPLFSLHLMRERLAAQAALISGAATADEASRSKQMSEHAAKVVHEMRAVHAGALKKQREDFRAEVRALSERHAEERAELEQALVGANERVEKVERESAVRLHKMMEGLELQHIAELDALREDFAARDPSAPPTQPRGKHSRPASAPGTPGGPPGSPGSPPTSRQRSHVDPAAANAALPPAVAETLTSRVRQEGPSSGSSARFAIEST